MDNKQKTAEIEKAAEKYRLSTANKMLIEKIAFIKGLEHSDQQTKELKEENERLTKTIERMGKRMQEMGGELVDQDKQILELKSQSSKEGITLPTNEEMEIKIGDRYHDHFYIKGFKDCFKWMRDLIQKQITK